MFAPGGRGGDYYNVRSERSAPSGLRVCPNPYGVPAAGGDGAQEGGIRLVQVLSGEDMMKKLVVWTLAMGLTASVATAETTLNVRVVSGGSSAITVTPGEVVDYQVLGQLKDGAGNNEGLALFGFDLTYDCGSLAQASAPATPEMAQFVVPDGINNPQGFGGTTDVPGKEGELVQIGGATNTINNVDTFAPYPLGTVVLGMGHSETVLAEGSLTIPGDATEGQVCNLVASNVFANTILLGETDDGTYWAVEATNQTGATPENLAMTVQTVVVALIPPTAPPCDNVLPRFTNNVLRLTFGGAISQPAAGEVEIRELQAAGGFGSDLSSQFNFAVEGTDVLRIEENGDVLADGAWYGITNSGGGWAGVADFQVDYVVVVGDVSNDGFNDFSDLSAIFANQTGAAADDDPYDINADGFVDFSDLSAAFGFNGSFDPGKPSDHGCTP
jgi:hypothetical protein